MIDETPSAYFVELKGSAAAFRTEAKATGLQYSERFTYNKLFNGLSIKLGSGQLNALQGLSNVKATYPVLRAELEPTSTTDLATAVAMTGADLANGSGFTGTGVKVAVMDTGVDYNHADLGGDGSDSDAASNDGAFDGDFPNSRVTTGWDFVGDAFDANENAATYNPVATPDPDPDDCHGHGTHVAGIVGANGAVKGVAPGVTFGAYRVFGCNGSTTSDIMLAAMERALADGMHVLNMSIGSAFMTWPQYPTAAGADALVDAGMVVVASIGNSGADGLYSAGAPGVGNKVIGTASYDNSHVSALTFDAPGRTGIAYLPITSTEDPPTSGTTPDVIWVGRGCNVDTYLGNPAGKVALIERGACTFAEKYNKAVANGAVDVIIHNNSAGLFAGGGIVGVAGISAVGISQADGLYLRSLTTPFGITWTANRVNAANPTGGQISSFSSYGMNAELTLKPDIGAPGGLIRSTYPLEKGAYAIISGTSMASPHVAGAAALLRQARPTLAASEFAAILQNSADPRNSPLAALPDYVHRQGAGMVDIDDSILSTTTMTPGKVSLGEGEGGTATISIKNSSASEQTYTMSHQAALNTGPNANSPFSFTAQFAPATVSFLPASVIVPAGGTATVVATIVANPGILQQAQYGGYLRATTGSGQVYRVPYAGLKGDYQSIQVLHPTANGFPWLAKRSATGYTNQPTGATYTFVDGDIPYFVAHFRHQARNAVFTVLDAATGLPVDPEFSTIIREDYLPRNSTSGAFFAYSWDGKRAFVDNGKKGKEHRRGVPDGQYKVRLTVLKALGDPANPAHTETWTSPTITIDRP
ncbi:MAG TPA: S8 family serine peptidase [Plantibacter sp.]|uniref:S8 family serine peptidase n=1 Tax=Plantibacter sp. TaxID=1871045 RepID=UPI002CFB81CB|nr:S8 family serine peptidase [Plantibacter sp.]